MRTLGGLLLLLCAVCCASALRHYELRSVPVRHIAVQDPPLQWMTQRLDHFDPQNLATFKQRVWLNATFWDRQSGPVFLSIGGEGPAAPIWAVLGSMMDYAARYHALAVLVEHRFYGESQPFSDLSTGNLRFLTSEQALADLAEIRVQLAAQLSMSSATRWVAFGGSYSGALAAWVRLKYPALFDGAVASSAPVLAKLNFTEYFDVVKASLETSTQGTACTQRIREATTAITAQLQTSAGRAALATQFQTCSAIVTNDDVANFMNNLAGNFAGVVQYNLDNRAFEGAVDNTTLQDLCTMMVSGTDPVAAFAAVNSHELAVYQQECLSVSYTDMIADLQNASLSGPQGEGGRQWTYQTCAEFGYYQSSDSLNQPFGGLFPLGFSLKQCVDVFGVLFSPSEVAANVAWSDAEYGGLDVASSFILFPNGSIDPWHALSVLTDLSPTELAVFIQGTAHCANEYPARDGDLPQLVTARQRISDTIGVWLKVWASK